MPYFIVKITVRESGEIRPPIIAHAEDEGDAREIVKYFCDARDNIVAKEIRNDVALACFGSIPKNYAMMSLDWVWEDKGNGDGIQVTIC